MVTEALVKANPYIKVKGFEGQLRKMSECASDFHAYWRLGEYIFRDIEHSWDPNLQPSRDIIDRLRRRDLFPLAGDLILKPEEVERTRGGAASVKEQLLQLNKKRFMKTLPGSVDPAVVAAAAASSSSSSSNALRSPIASNSQSTVEDSPGNGPMAKANGVTLSHAFANGCLDLKSAEDDIFCCLIKLDYGKGGKDPVSEMTTFFKPVKFEDDGTPRTNGLTEWVVGPAVLEAVTRLVPREYQETQLRVYCRHKSQRAVVESLVEEWSARKGEILTPLKRCKTL